MTSIHTVLNIVLALTTLISLPIILLPYLVFKLLSYIKRSIFSENVTGKVVLITGASSGIGEGLAYEYARRGARLALVARREDRLRVVADKARTLGSSDVFVISADVAKVEDCKRIVNETLNHFGQLDHSVNNAGIAKGGDLFEDCAEVSDLAPAMDVNFWGSTYCTHFAIPHLKERKGKIAVIASIAAWSPTPGLTVYNASKAALVSFYETLRVECGPHVGITIVLPGLIETEMTGPSLLSKYRIKILPLMETPKQCAEAIVRSTCRGDKYLTEPLWWNTFFMLKLLCPDIFEWLYYWNFTINGAQKKHQQANDPKS